MKTFIWGFLTLGVVGLAALGAWWLAEPERPDPQLEAAAQQTVSHPLEGDEATMISDESARPVEVVEANEVPDQAKSGASPEADEVLQGFLERGCIDDSLTRIAQLPPVRRAELDSWLESEGEFGGVFSLSSRDLSAFDDYSSYDRATLEQLALDHRDGKAQVTLGARLANERNYREASRWFREAAINGYSAPIGHVGFLHIMHRVQEYRDQAETVNQDEYENAVHDALLEYVAYVEFATARGAPMAEPTLRLLKNRGMFNRSDSETDGFSESELEIAEERGRALYEEFEAERLKRGLPPFDNSRPEIADLIDADMHSRLSARAAGLRPCN